MIRTIQLDLTAPTVIEFPKRVQIMNVQGVLATGDAWKFKSDSLSENFVDAIGQNFPMYMTGVDNQLGLSPVYVDFHFENWNVLTFDYSSTLGAGILILTFEDYA
jgi:hypothetical protein